MFEHVSKHCNYFRYVSSDFGNHPLSHLMGSVFGMHDREHVEVFCYALSPSDGSEWRQRISAEAEHFIDVSAMASDAIARMINESQIQILVNLNGYTKVCVSSEYSASLISLLCSTLMLLKARALCISCFNLRTICLSC